MPWHIEDDNPDCNGYAVVKDDDGEIEGCHETEAQAQAQLAALYASEANRMKTRSGRVLSSKNEEKLRAALAALTEVLAQLGEEINAGAPTGEVRTFDMTNVEVRADADGPVVAGYASVFNRKSVMLYDFREVILPGAFAATLERNPDVRALWNHDVAAVLGRTTNGTLRLWEDNTGLGFELYPADTQIGRDAVELIRRGDVNQMSFSFSLAPGNDTWAKDADGVLLRTVSEVDRLIEVSPVTWPAYPDTIATLRNAPEWVRRALIPNGDFDSTTVLPQDQATLARARDDLMRRIKIIRAKG